MSGPLSKAGPGGSASLDIYRDFVVGKSQIDARSGFARTYRNPAEHDFQSFLIDWACEQGRGATFADCGLGKTLMQLVWAENVHRQTNKPALIVAPLSVSAQTVDEAAKFDMQAVRVIDGKVPHGVGVVTTNYERLHHFDPDDFGGVVCDESSILKNFDGAFKARVTEFMRRVQFRGLYTATPSPNDYIELGTSSEALGHLGHMDMLGTFFKNDEGNLHPAFIGTKWRFKAHAERDFWRWVASWARAVRKPSDLGFDDRHWVLPDLIEVDHEIQSAAIDGYLFALPARGLSEEREERKATVRPRCEKAAELLAPADCAVAWCHLNEEADLICDLLPGAVNLSGADPDEAKEEKFRAFRSGQIRHLVTKPKIAAFGVNWQHCQTATYFTDYSFEQYYQAVRRFWRFGQTKPVTIHNISTQSLANVAASRKGKAAAAEEMFRQMVEQMNDALQLKRFHEHRARLEVPQWL